MGYSVAPSSRHPLPHIKSAFFRPGPLIHLSFRQNLSIVRLTFLLSIHIRIYYVSLIFHVFISIPLLPSLLSPHPIACHYVMSCCHMYVVVSCQSVMSLCHTSMSCVSLSCHLVIHIHYRYVFTYVN